MKSIPALLHLTGYAGNTISYVRVVGETPKRYRIESDTAIRLAGRNRWLEPGTTALVPKHAISFPKLARSDA